MMIASCCTRLRILPGIIFSKLAILIVITFLLLSVGTSTSDAMSAKVEDLRIGLKNSTTRLVIEVDQKISPYVFGLANPYRIVIDLPKVNFVLPNQRFSIRGGVIDRLRYGAFRPESSRLVLDLKTPAKVSRKFILSPNLNNNWRLVIDLSPTDHEEFLSTMRPKPTIKESQLVPKKPLPTVPKPFDLPTIVIDAGHGGVDPGAIGISGVHEKDIVLSYAKEIKRQLENKGGIKVYLTRDKDVFIPLRDRVKFARSVDADLFISLHANSHKNSKTNGFSVYTLSENASDAEAQALAAKENKSDVIGGLDLGAYSNDVQNILIDFTQAKTNELSVILARDNLISEASFSVKLLNRPWRSAGFAVLKAPDIPSALIELGYLTNKKEEGQLQNQNYRKNLSSAIARSLLKYLKNN